MMVICLFVLGNSPFLSGRSLVIITLVLYLAFRFRIDNLRLSCLWHTLFCIYMIVVVLHSCMFACYLVSLSLTWSLYISTVIYMFVCMP